MFTFICSKTYLPLDTIAFCGSPRNLVGYKTKTNHNDNYFRHPPRMFLQFWHRKNHALLYVRHLVLRLRGGWVGPCSCREVSSFTLIKLTLLINVYNFFSSANSRYPHYNQGHEKRPKTDALWVNLLTSVDYASNKSTGSRQILS